MSYYVEHWEQTVVYGSTPAEDNRLRVEEMDVLHRRGEDPVKIACRRSNKMAQQTKFETWTRRAFDRKVVIDPHVARADISRDERKEEWDW